MYIAGIARMNTVRLNTRTGMGGEGIEPEIIFSIAIHKPAPQKLLQRGRYLLLEIVGVVRR